MFEAILVILATIIVGFWIGTKLGELLSDKELKDKEKKEEDK